MTAQHRVWIDQDLCTGDGICVQEARDVFEFDIDGLAYVKNADGELLTATAAQTDVPAGALVEVVEAARLRGVDEEDLGVEIGF